MSATGWRRTLGLGAIWGAATWIVEVAALPPPTFGIVTLADWLAMVTLVGPQWFVAGTGMAVSVMWAERHLDSAGLVMAAVLFALAWGIFSSMVIVPMACRFGLSLPTAALFPGLQPSCEAHYVLKTWAYVSWEMLLIAATFTPVYVLSARAERTRSLLGRAEIARRQSEEAVDQARLQLLQRQIDPTFLSHVMGVVQERYAKDPVGADRLLDRLVAFLRSVMPGLRGQASTLDAELAILRARAQLQDELQPGAGAWQIEANRAEVGDFAFPPLLLLPMLDELCSGSAPRPAWAVTARRQEGEVHLTLQVRSAVAQAAQRRIEQRMYPGLHPLLDPAGLDVRADATQGTTIVTLRLHAAVAS